MDGACFIPVPSHLPQTEERVAAILDHDVDLQLLSCGVTFMFLHTVVFTCNQLYWERQRFSHVKVFHLSWTRALLVSELSWVWRMKKLNKYYGLLTLLHLLFQPSLHLVWCQLFCPHYQNELLSQMWLRSYSRKQRLRIGKTLLTFMVLYRTQIVPDSDWTWSRSTLDLVLIRN